MYYVGSMVSMDLSFIYAWTVIMRTGGDMLGGGGSGAVGF